MKKHLSSCTAKDKVCPGCKVKGRTPAHCPCKGEGPERTPGPPGRPKAKSVRVPRNYRVKVPFDNCRTPNMEDVQFRPTGGLGAQIPWGKSQTHPAYPDTGAEQSMVSEDLLETLGLSLEKATKAVEAVDGGCVTCLTCIRIVISHLDRPPDRPPEP